MEKRSYKSQNIETKYLKTVIKKHFVKAKSSLFEFEKTFIELKDTELKNREIKIKKEIEGLFIKPIVVSVEDMDRFEEE